MKSTTVFEQLKTDAMYAQRNYAVEFLHQTYGAATMAWQLGAITAAEEEEVRSMTIGFMATDPEYIRQKNDDILRDAWYIFLKKKAGVRQ